MSQLSDRLLQSTMRKRVVGDCAALISERLRSMRGLRGITVRTAFSALETFKPDFVPRVLNRLLPDFVAVLDELYFAQRQDASAQDADFSAIILHHPDAVVEGLLRMSDKRVAQVRHPIVQHGYKRLRGFAKREVTDVLPELAGLLRQWLA